VGVEVIVKGFRELAYEPLTVRISWHGNERILDRSRTRKTRAMLCFDGWIVLNFYN
jgi:hypothetical protein